MRIVNLETFRKLPAGTVFMKYTPCIFEDLQVKGETWEHDFLSENITYWPDHDSEVGFDNVMAIAESGEDIQLDFDCLGRDGFLNKDQLFAVYSKSDVEMLQEKLKRCLSNGYMQL